jgi:nucleoside 2-deoxyribosyltransferase
MRIYLASDLGFTEPGKHYLYNVLIPSFAKAGVTVIDPWKLTDETVLLHASSCEHHGERVQRWKAANRIIGGNNANAIRECDALAAVLDGSDVDSGTAAEIGFAAALGKKAYGLRTDFRLSADNEGSRVNLQVEYFIHMNGGRIAGSVDELISAVIEGGAASNSG